MSLGFLRDYIFYNINAHINYLTWYHINYTEAPVYAFVKDMSVSELNWSKWGLTIVFSEMFYALGMVSIFLTMAKPKQLMTIFSWLYIVIAFLGMIFQSITWIFDTSIGYDTARFFMHMLQSPLPFLFIIPATLLRKTS